MHLTEADITEFQTLYLKHFGKEISRKRAYEEATQLIRLIQLIYKPINKADDERVHGHNRKDGANR